MYRVVLSYLRGKMHHEEQVLYVGNATSQFRNIFFLFLFNLVSISVSSLEPEATFLSSVVFWFSTCFHS